MQPKVGKYRVAVKVPKTTTVIPFLVWASDREKAKDCAYFHAKIILSQSAGRE